MADSVKRIGLQFFLQDTKDVAKQLKEFAKQNKIELSAELENSKDFEEVVRKLTEKINNEFKEGLNINSLFKEAVDGKEVNEAIRNVETLIQKVEILNEQLGENTEKQRAKIGHFNNAQVEQLIQQSEDIASNKRIVNKSRYIKSAIKTIGKNVNTGAQEMSVGTQEIGEKLDKIHGDIQDIKRVTDDLAEGKLKVALEEQAEGFNKVGEAAKEASEKLEEFQQKSDKIQNTPPVTKPNEKKDEKPQDNKPKEDKPATPPVENRKEKKEKNNLSQLEQLEQKLKEVDNKLNTNKQKTNMVRIERGDLSDTQQVIQSYLELGGALEKIVEIAPKVAQAWKDIQAAKEAEKEKVNTKDLKQQEEENKKLIVQTADKLNNKLKGKNDPEVYAQAYHDLADEIAKAKEEYLKFYPLLKSQETTENKGMSWESKYESNLDLEKGIAKREKPKQIANIKQELRSLNSELAKGLEQSSNPKDYLEAYNKIEAKVQELVNKLKELGEETDNLFQQRGFQKLNKDDIYGSLKNKRVKQLEKEATSTSKNLDKIQDPQKYQEAYEKVKDSIIKIKEELQSLDYTEWDEKFGDNLDFEKGLAKRKEAIENQKQLAREQEEAGRKNNEGLREQTGETGNLTDAQRELGEAVGETNEKLKEQNKIISETPNSGASQDSQPKPQEDKPRRTGARLKKKIILPTAPQSGYSSDSQKPSQSSPIQTPNNIEGTTSKVNNLENSLHQTGEEAVTVEKFLINLGQSSAMSLDKAEASTKQLAENLNKLVEIFNKIKGITSANTEGQLDLEKYFNALQIVQQNRERFDKTAFTSSAKPFEGKDLSYNNKSDKKKVGKEIISQFSSFENAKADMEGFINLMPKKADQIRANMKKEEEKLNSLIFTYINDFKGELSDLNLKDIGGNDSEGDNEVLKFKFQKLFEKIRNQALNVQLIIESNEKVFEDLLKTELGKEIDTTANNNAINDFTTIRNNIISYIQNFLGSISSLDLRDEEMNTVISEIQNILPSIPNNQNLHVLQNFDAENIYTKLKEYIQAMLDFDFDKASEIANNHKELEAFLQQFKEPPVKEEPPQPSPKSGKKRGRKKKTQQPQQPASTPPTPPTPTPSSPPTPPSPPSPPTPPKPPKPTPPTPPTPPTSPDQTEEEIKELVQAYETLNNIARKYYDLVDRQRDGEIFNPATADNFDKLTTQYQNAMAVIERYEQSGKDYSGDARVQTAEENYLNKNAQIVAEQKNKQEANDAKELINIYKQLYDTYYSYQQLLYKQKSGEILNASEKKKLQEYETELDKLSNKLLEFSEDKNKVNLWSRTDVGDAERKFVQGIQNNDIYQNGDRLKQIASDYNNLYKSENKMRKLELEQMKSPTINRSQEIAALKMEIDGYTKSIKENTKAIKENGDVASMQMVKTLKRGYNAKTKTSANAFNQALNEDRTRGIDTRIEGINELQGKYMTAEYTNVIPLIQQLQAELTTLENLKQQINDKPLDIANEAEIKALDEQLKNIDKRIKDIKENSKKYKTADTGKLTDRISDFLSKNHGLSKEARDSLQEYLDLLSRGVNVSQLKEIGTQFEEIRRKEIEAGNTGQTFFDVITFRVRNLAASLATYVSFWSIFNQIKQGLGILKQFDDALAEMQKVSNNTLETLREFQTTTFDLADSIGSDALALQQSVAEFMRLGQSLEEATDSAKSANILLNVSEFTNASEASEALIAMSQAYQDLSNMEIIDVINKLGNDFPISTQGLATALQDGAASLTTAGNNFYEAAALVTAGNRITQDPSKVGKAMRTIALRLTGTEASKAELEEDGEEIEGMITNVSKLRDVIMQATKVEKNGFKGFDILKDNGAYKSTYEILLGISEIYEDIVKNDEETGAKGANLLLETIAGKNRASVAASILQSPDMLKRAYEEAIDAEGSAEIENAKFIDSISGHLEKLKNAWQELWANATTREFVNAILDFATAILEAVNNLGLLKSAFVALAGLDIFKFLFFDKGLTSGIVHSILQVTTKTATKGMVSGVSEAATETLTDALTEAGETGGESFLSVLISKITAGGIGKALANGTAEATVNIANLGKAFSAALIPIGEITIALAAIAAIMKAIDVLNLFPSETAKEAEQIASSFQTAQENIKSHQQTIDELSETYTELSKSVNTSTNANLTLSNEEYQKYLDTCNKIADLYPQLVTGYDLQGNAIVNLTGNVKELTQALEEEQKVASQNFLNGETGDDKSFIDKILGFFGIGNGDKNSIRDSFNHNYEEYQNLEEVSKVLKDYFLGREVTLEDYHLFEDELREKALNGDSLAWDVKFVFEDISEGIVDTDEKLEHFLNNLSKMGMSKEMQQSMQQAQQTLFSNLTLNDDYWDLIHNEDADISKNASSLFTNIINSMSPEQASELLNSTEEEVTASVSDIVQTVNNLLTDTADNRFNWSEILNNEDLKKAVDGYKDSFDTLNSLGYSNEAIFSMARTGKVGNVNLNTDRAIQWNEDNLNKYISQLRGWNEGLSDEEIKKKFKNETSTVFGSGETFDFGKGTIDLSFATITEDGRLLDIEDIYSYIQTILSQAEESGEPLTIDTVLKFDAQGVTDENGNTIKNMIAGEGFNASEAMHEVELLKGYGDIEGYIKTVDEARNTYGNFVRDIVGASGDLHSSLKGITSFQDILDDLNNYSIGEGILANANMGDFAKIADLYKQALIDGFEDTNIDGEKLFESMFKDEEILGLTERFNQVLDNASFIQNDTQKQQALDYFNSLGQEEAKMYTESFKDATSFEDVDRKFGGFQRSLAAKAHEAIINIEDETAAINTLKSAISSSNGDTGLSSEEITNLETLFKDLMDEDGNPLYSAPELFENTANGIRLNQKQLKKLNNEYKRERIEEATDKLDYYQKALIETENEIEKLRNAKEKEADLSAEERNRDNILQNIDALQREITQYEGLTSAYNEYVNALSTANGNAGYDTIQSGYDTVKDLIDRGWGGADEVRQYVQMFSKEDVSSWSVDKLIERFNELDDAINSAGYSYKDFFTVDEDGKTTSDGVFNFLDALKQQAKDKADDYHFSDAMIDQLVSVEKRYSDATHQMEDFYSFDFDAIGGDQAVADLMDMDISTLHKWLEAAEAAGFDVVWTDYAHKVANATKTIKQAKEALEEFKDVNAEDYKLNTSVDSVEAVETELSKAQELIQEIQSDDTISPEVSTAKLDYVQAQLDSLIQTKLILEQPLLFNTNLADVEGEYQDLFLALQNYGMELQTVQAYGRVGLPIDTSQADRKLKDILKALQGLDEKTKKEFGIDFDLEDEDALEQLKEKFANAEISIPINQVMGDTFDYSKLPQGKDTIVKVKTILDDNGTIQGLQLIDSLGNVIDGSNYVANVDAKDNATPVANTAQENLEDFEGTYIANAKVDVNDKEINEANKDKASFQKSASSNWTINSNIQSFYRSFTDIKNDFVKPRTTTWTIKHVSQSSGTAVRPPTGSGGGGFIAPPLYRGTAHALGTAYARGTSGNWGVPEDQDALVGELGEELVVFLCHYIQ